MSVIKGKVEVVRQNDQGYWSLKVGETWYSAGKSEPKVTKGDLVQFEAEQNDRGYWNANTKTLKKATREAPSGVSEGTTAPAKAGGYSGGGNGYNSPERLAADEKRQHSIEFQAARNSAIEFVGKLLSAGIVALGGNKAEQTGIVELYLAKYTNQFYADTQKLEASAPNAEAGSSKGATTRKAPAKAAAPEPEQTDGREDDYEQDDIPF